MSAVPTWSASTSARHAEYVSEVDDVFDDLGSKSNRLVTRRPTIHSECIHRGFGGGADGPVRSFGGPELAGLERCTSVRSRRWDRARIVTGLPLVVEHGVRAPSLTSTRGCRRRRHVAPV